MLFNPIAGRGRAVQVAGAVCARLTALGHEATEQRSERAGHIEALAEELADRVDRVLVLGGDGSLREAAAGLLRRDPGARAELGVLPFGTGNVVARELGLPLDPLGAVDVIAASGAHPWDVGVARAEGGAEETFLAMAGVGFDAAISARIDAARATPLGARAYRLSADLLYGWCGLSELLRPGQPRFQVSVDGAPVAARAVAAIAANTRVYGKGMWFSRSARPNDGRLDVHLRERANPLVGAAVLALAQLKRPIPRRMADEVAGLEVRVEALDGGRALPWQLDGDRMEPTRALDLSLRPAALRIVGP